MTTREIPFKMDDGTEAHVTIFYSRLTGKTAVSTPIVSMISGAEIDNMIAALREARDALPGPGGTEDDIEQLRQDVRDAQAVVDDLMAQPNPLDAPAAPDCIECKGHAYVTIGDEIYPCEVCGGTGKAPDAALMEAVNRRLKHPPAPAAPVRETPRLTRAQRDALAEMVAGGRIFGGSSGGCYIRLNDYGKKTIRRSTYTSMRDAGLVGMDGKVTPLGRAALAAAQRETGEGR